MTVVIVEQELTTNELKALIQQLDIREQIELLKNVMCDWQVQEHYDEIKVWLED